MTTTITAGTLPKEYEDLRTTVADFARTVVAPVSAKHDEEHSFPYEVVAKMAEMGLFGLPFPEEYGGMGGDYFALALALEELGKVDQSVAITLEAALIFFFLAGVLWFVLARHEKASLAAFYIFTACVGLVHTLLLGVSIPGDDLRRLPDEKTLDTTQWRGLIIEEPAAQLSAHASRRALDRTSFVLRMEAWRPTGGRLFGADIDTPWQPAQGDVRCTVATVTPHAGKHDRKRA